MELLQAKIRCVRHIADSGWFKPGRNLTLFRGENSDVLSQLFKSLEAVHPLYDVKQRIPFADHPRIWKQGDYTRQVILEKKTAVCVVFSSDPEQVRTLALLDDSLFETDRIELGRRLDYSRWTSFVELSESARWSDIDDDMHRLLEIKTNNLPGGELDHDDAFILSRKKTDRVKGELADQCLAWLYYNEKVLREKEGPLFEQCLHKVNLNERYKLARRAVAEQLPPIIRLYPELTLRNRYTFAEINEAGLSLDPVTNLFYRIYHRYGLNSLSVQSLTVLQEQIKQFSSRKNMGGKSVVLAVDRNGFVPQFSNGSSSSLCSGRFKYINLVAFLVGLLWNDLPFFLFDKYDHGMCSDEQMEFTLLCEKLSCHKQVIVALADGEKVFDLKDAVTLHVDSKGAVT